MLLFRWFSSSENKKKLKNVLLQQYTSSRLASIWIQDLAGNVVNPSLKYVKPEVDCPKGYKDWCLTYPLHGQWLTITPNWHCKGCGWYNPTRRTYPKHYQECQCQIVLSNSSATLLSPSATICIKYNYHKSALLEYICPAWHPALLTSKNSLKLIFYCF